MFFLGKLRAAARSRSGNVIVLFSLVAPILLYAVGLSVDYGRLVMYKSAADRAADAAVLATIARSAYPPSYFYQFSDGERLATNEQLARDVFQANFASDGGETPAASIDVDVHKSGGRVVSRLSYTLKVPLTFAGVLGAKKKKVKGTSKARIDLGQRIDFYLLLDNSPSMGLGATQADIDAMQSLTSDNCAFACHDQSSTNDYFTLAKNNGVTLRIQSVRNATKDLTATARDFRESLDQFRMGVYSFGKSANTRSLTRVVKLTDDLDRVDTKVAGIDLMVVPYQNYDSDQLTSFEDTLGNLGGEITDPGSGYGADEPRKIVFLVSDGVGDSYKPVGCQELPTSGRCQEPIDAALCNALKDRGIEVAVLYTTYLKLPGNDWYRTWIDPFHPKIAKQMEACASPGLFFEVTPTDGISEAMTALFLKAVSTPILTQ